MKENIREIFGLDEECDLFADGVKRRIYPVTMRNFPKFIENLNQVNMKKLWVTSLFEDSFNNAVEVLRMSFRDDDPEMLMDLITAKSFQEIMTMISKINGIEIEEAKEDDDSKNEEMV